MTDTVLALNPGSSSLKVAVRRRELELTIEIERLGDPGGSLRIGPDGAKRSFTGDLGAAIEEIKAELQRRDLAPDAVAHRVVHGGPHHYRPTRIDDDLLADLRAAIPLAPLHLPGVLDVIEHARRAWPNVVQVACFDTGFHHDLPESSIRLPVPAELVEAGVRRYGFHGLSIQSVLHARPELDQVVIAHLGSGCSVTAVAGGRPRHTTMSLTPTGGMVSATRTGDLDPEIVLYLIERHGYRVDQLRTLLDHGSGLAGIADGRHDVRDLLAAPDPDAGLAIEIFARSAAMAIAACATTLDAWSNLVFTGGVGEHSAPLREAICARLLALRGAAPAEGTNGSEDALRRAGVDTGIVAADEEGVLDRLTRALLAGTDHS